MPSSITWLDHDAQARERSLRILALFQERESRDELGLGAIRDSLADQLFPGTSTIQTRLRYMLVVPWVYRHLEEKGTPAAEMAAKARRLELSLIASIMASGETEGVFGRMAGKGLKRLPSSVYWAGLQKWGILHFAGSQDQYHRSIGAIYRRREELRESREAEEGVRRGALTWNQHLPSVPEGFPEALSLKVTKKEAEFLLDKIATGAETKQTLLAHLAAHCRPSEVALPWEHEERATFPKDHQLLLDQGRRFSLVMHGAALIYNIALSRIAGKGDLEQQLLAMYDEWVEDLGHEDVLRDWSPGQLWDRTVGAGHEISRPTRVFVETWVAAVAREPAGLPNDLGIQELVRRREQGLKGSRSRYLGGRLLDQWGGKAGLQRMDYRWFRVKRLLKDLDEGLGGSA
jgi:hypothetical protein